MAAGDHLLGDGAADAARPSGDDAARWFEHMRASQAADGPIRRPWIAGQPDTIECNAGMTRSRLVPVLLAAVLLVGAANLGAYAATGGPLLLGKSNTASKTTTLKTTGNGAALSLKSKAGKAPLKVSNSTKVAKLNADLVDGAGGDAWRPRATSTTSTATGVSRPLRLLRATGSPARAATIANYSVSAQRHRLPDLLRLLHPDAGPAPNGARTGHRRWASTTAAATGSRAVAGTSTRPPSTHRFACQRGGGTGHDRSPRTRSLPGSRWSSPASTTSPSAATTGVGGTLPRGLAP